MNLFLMHVIKNLLAVNPRFTFEIYSMWNTIMIPAMSASSFPACQNAH